MVVCTALTGRTRTTEKQDKNLLHRLFYVACTGARKNLYILQEQTRDAYSLTQLITREEKANEALF